MMKQLSLEERVTALEAQVAAMRSPRKLEDRKKDWRRTIGMFAGDEVMRRIDEEALKYRERDRRKARRRRGKRPLTKP